MVTTAEVDREPILEIAKKGGGPVTEEGKQISRGNALKHGLSGAGTVLPEELKVRVEEALRGFRQDFQPRTELENQLVYELAVAAVQRKRCFELEMEQQAINQQHDVQHWNDDLLLRAAIWGEKLAERPDRVTCELWRFSAGCGWLRERWEALETGLQGPVCTWDDDEFDRALDLLGTPRNERQSGFWARELQRHREGARVEGPDTSRHLEALRDIVAGQIQSLERAEKRLAEGCERHEYEALLRGARFDMSPAVRNLRRLAAAADRRFDQALKRLTELRQSQPAPTPRAPETPRPSRPASPHRPAPASGQERLSSLDGLGLGNEDLVGLEALLLSTKSPLMNLARSVPPVIPTSRTSDSQLDRPG